eukprot:gene12170-14884_t
MDKPLKRKDREENKDKVVDSDECEYSDDESIDDVFIPSLPKKKRSTATSSIQKPNQDTPKRSITNKSNQNTPSTTTTTTTSTTSTPKTKTKYSSPSTALANENDEKGLLFLFSDETEVNEEFPNITRYNDSVVYYNMDQINSEAGEKVEDELDIENEDEYDTENEDEIEGENNTFEFIPQTYEQIESLFSSKHFKQSLDPEFHNMIKKNWNAMKPIPLSEPTENLKNIPDDCKEPINFFMLLFTGLIDDIKLISKEDITKYLVIFFIFGLYGESNIKDLWNNQDPILNSLEGVFPFQKWKYIHRCIHVRNFFGDNRDQNESSDENSGDERELYGSESNRDEPLSIDEKYYGPTLVFSLDDDSSGKGGSKNFLHSEADRIDNILWKLADENKYIYHFEVEKNIKRNLLPHEILNEKILRNVEKNIPKGPFSIIINAGIMGSFENALFLHKNNRRYIVSVSSDRIKKTLNAVLDDPKSNLPASRIHGEVNSARFGILNVGSSTPPLSTTNFKNTMCAVAWKAKEDKIVYFYSNMIHPLHPLTDDPGYPRIASVYNYTRNFVDVSKMIVNRHRNIHRAREYWRSIFNDIINILLFNSFILYSLNEKKKNSSSSLLSYKDYILSIFRVVIGNIIPSTSSNSYTLTIPSLISKKERRVCHLKEMCLLTNYSKRTNNSCPCHPELRFHPECSMKYHNPGIEISFISPNQ